jgi:hypothetical protein
MIVCEAVYAVIALGWMKREGKLRLRCPRRGRLNYGSACSVLPLSMSAHVANARALHFGRLGGDHLRPRSQLQYPEIGLCSNPRLLTLSYFAHVVVRRRNRSQ